jgi:hypothetical protein
MVTCSSAGSPVLCHALAQSNAYSIRWALSTKDQLLFSALHGTAMRYAGERRNLDESIEELRQIADGRNDVLAEAAGIAAGSWYASPGTHVGYELIGAGLLVLAGGGRGLPLDYDELERWTRVGFERGMRSRRGSGEGRPLSWTSKPLWSNAGPVRRPPLP